jgi:hypothetical protein
MLSESVNTNSVGDVIYGVGFTDGSDGFFSVRALLDT